MANLKVTGFKGFNKNMQCNGFQYKEGETYEHKGEAKLCSQGFHFCEYPLDVFNYYAPASSNFNAISAEGVTTEKDGDTKRVCNKITIGAKIDFASLTKAAIDFTWEHVRKEQSNNKENKIVSNSGDSGAASNSGYRGAASNSGDRGAASNSGYRGAALTTGALSAAENIALNGIAVAWGVGATASGVKGTYIVVSEWDLNAEGALCELKHAEMIKIDGKRYKENTPYIIKNGKIQEGTK
jgi:hypothetical protein